MTARAPGRVNLIGEHVDYNDGLVLPLAIDRYCHIAAAPREDGLLRIHSRELDETVEVHFRQPPADHHWSDYVAGVAWSLSRASETVLGADLLVASDVALGAGLSSSAALEVATAYALLALAGDTLDPVDVALVCQRAENRYAGAQVGIMDQLTSALGVAGHALLIDCRSLETTAIPLDEISVAVVVADTGVKHELASGEYNRRREECQAALELVRRDHGETRALRDIAWEEIDQASQAWPPPLRQRARHVTTEIERVRQAAAALAVADNARVGALMAESHASLDRDFEVSSPELNLMVELARGLPGLLGARMMGGGFGGSTVNLVAAPLAEAFADKLAGLYADRTGTRPQTSLVRSADGAAITVSTELTQKPQIV